MKPRKRVGNAENYLIPCEAAWRTDSASFADCAAHEPIVTPVTVAQADTLYQVDGRSRRRRRAALSDAEAALAPGAGPRTAARFRLDMSGGRKCQAKNGRSLKTARPGCT